MINKSNTNKITSLHSAQRDEVDKYEKIEEELRSYYQNLIYEPDIKIYEAMRLVLSHNLQIGQSPTQSMVV
jgi:hypothetical protein